MHVLAQGCGINVPEGRSDHYASDQRTFLVRRFDRPTPEQRIHFASAMTLTGHLDGDDSSTGASYLEIAEILIEQGASATEDLRELWCRIVFNLCVSNTDDHLRNHGFLLVPGWGWRLSPAYDMNPTYAAEGLKLNITEKDNALDLELAREVADYFRYSLAEADQKIAQIKMVVSKWPSLADELGISRKEKEMMTPAFELAT